MVSDIEIFEYIVIVVVVVCCEDHHRLKRNLKNFLVASTGIFFVVARISHNWWQGGEGSRQAALLFSSPIARII